MEFENIVVKNKKFHEGIGILPNKKKEISRANQNPIFYSSREGNS